MPTDPLLGWLEPYGFRILLTLVMVLGYWLLDRFTTPKLTEGAELGKFKEGAADKAILAARFLTGIAGLLALVFIWGIPLTSVLVFAGTTLTFLGVAFFASWSLLSNVTAYFILLMHPTYRRGTFVRVIDADNYVEGYIADLSMFNVKLISDNREVIVYPNTMLLARPAIVNPRDRLGTSGKIFAAPAPLHSESPPV